MAAAKARAEEKEAEEEEEGEAEDPLRQAAAEGLTLQRAKRNSQTGWKHVEKKGNRFCVRYYDRKAKRQRWLKGSSATAEQVVLE